MDLPTYQPISCEVHDLLEASATMHTTVDLQFRDEEGTIQRRRTRIVDVFSRSGAEYMFIGTGETIRLDQMLAIEPVKARSA